MKNGPPTKEEMAPSALFKKLSQETPNDRPFETVDFPRKDSETGEPIGKCAMWPLKEREIIAAKAEATRKALEALKLSPDKKDLAEQTQVWNDICATELLVRCCREIDNRNIPIFPNGAAVRDFLTSDEMSVLSVRYAEVQHSLGPIVANMSDEEYEAWVDRIGEGGAEVPLSSLSWELRNHLLRRTCKELRTYRTAKSSAGSPPAASTTESENFD